MPYPSQEHNAIDAVVQYAIEELDFDPEQIVMFGWSIGGYSAAWAAVNYSVRGLVNLKKTLIVIILLFINSIVTLFVSLSFFFFFIYL